MIFVALALVWAVVLLPKALRHHDELAQTRSVERVSDGMRVLARREVVSAREARLVVPAAPAPPPAPAAPAETPTPLTADRLRARIAAHRKAAAAAARRRRMILGALLVVALGVGVAAGLGRLPLWSVAAPVAVIVAFLVSARFLVRRERARRDAELSALKARVVETQEVQPIVEVLVETVEDEALAAPATAGTEERLAVVSGLDDTSCFRVGLLDDVAPTTDAGSLWDPLPVTLPTYVTKPRATRSVRTIDLNAPGVSSSGHDAASSALVADAATSPPDDLPQRAVGS